MSTDETHPGDRSELPDLLSPGPLAPARRESLRRGALERVERRGRLVGRSWLLGVACTAALAAFMVLQPTEPPTDAPDVPPVAGEWETALFYAELVPEEAPLFEADVLPEEYAVLDAALFGDG